MPGSLSTTGLNSGGGTGIRTLDLRIKSPLLYQLSYTPHNWWAVQDSNLRPMD